MTAIRQIRWGRIVVAAFLAEVSVIAIFFLLLFGAMLAGVPELARPLSTLDYVDAMVSSFAMVFVFTLWVGRRIESGFVLHGILVGAVAMLLFVALNFGLNRTLEEPPLYWVAHGLKILGGITGGLVVERRRRHETIVAAGEARVRG
jgi:hypothetical protein